VNRLQQGIAFIAAHAGMTRDAFVQKAHANVFDALESKGYIAREGVTYYPTEAGQRFLADRQGRLQ
jgi:hypothetical protein